MRFITELLAPAKDKETAIFAIDCGADAVYMGACNFGARKNASNSLDDIQDVVNYAHKFWAKVFITINTILTDSELEDAIKLIKKLDKIGVDAIIIQDMGLLKKLKDLGLSIPLHASTQCDNRDLEKIKFFNDIGLSRAVLARELSLEQIKTIHKNNPKLELEAFVHGALCVSYSGQCYLSQYIGGRSANRGECAQPCRKKYTIKNCDGKILAKDIHALCLKDFNASKLLKDMIEAGVYSFKIEGRLKEKNYVKNITAYYRQELDKYSKKSSSGKSFIKFIPNPEKSFNRGFTTYFLEERKDCYNFVSPKSRGEYIGEIVEIGKDFLVINTKKELHPQDGLMYETGGFLINKVQGKKIYPNKELKEIFGLFKGSKIFRNFDAEFEKELEKNIKRQIAVNIEYSNNTLKLIDEDGVSFSIEITGFEKAKNNEKMKETFIKQISKTGESDFYVENIQINSDLPFIPVSEINELRRKTFESLMQKRLEKYKREVQCKIRFAKFYKSELDYRANIHNKEAKSFYEQCGCNILENSLESNMPKRQVELMRSKHCIKYALNMCKSPQNLVLVDEFGKNFPLKFDCKNCEMIVLSPIDV